MLEIKFSSKFIKEYKCLQKIHWDVDKIKKVMEIIADGKPLPSKYKNHFLKGKWKEYQECHIEADLLLVYRIENKTLILYRIAKHDDIF